MSAIRHRGHGWLRILADNLAMKPEDRVIGGRAGSSIWLVGGLVFGLLPVLPGHADKHPLDVEALAAGAFAFGVYGSFFCRWGSIHRMFSPLSAIVGFCLIALGVYISGGTRSPIWTCYYWAVPLGCYFYPRAFGVALMVLAITAQALPLLYDPQALHDGYVGMIVVASAGYLVVGCSVMAGKEFYESLRMRSETFAAEQQALKRAASAVLRGESADRIFQTVSAEAASLLGSSMAGVFQVMAPDEVVTIGHWSDGSAKLFAPGELVKLLPDGGFRRVLDTRSVLRNNNLAELSVARARGCAATLMAAVVVEDEPWGVICLASTDPHAFSRGSEQRLVTFAEMLAQIVTTLEERARLESEALTDQLTGLPNHRALHQRLAAELAASARHGRPLAVAMIDLDNFKEINDIGGHAKGDEALRLVARCLSDISRANDVVGRLGGDEFMWIMPNTDSHQALNAVERARELIGCATFVGRHPSTSGGICDTSSTSDAAEIVRRADVALYASKAAGRNQVTLYDADVAAALGPNARDAWTQRSQSLAGLRALARAVDAKDPATNEHSERVASFAGRLAQAAGWSDERIARLREAGLVHDVGKLAVPDALLTKPGVLTERERIQINEHVELSVRIVGSILSDEQVAWIRGHHERPDGGGYPDGLMGDQISDGAALLALADAWDVMVAGRTYSRPKTRARAYAECLELCRVQFMPVAVDALRALYDAGWLELDADPEDVSRIDVGVEEGAEQWRSREHTRGHVQA